MATVRKKREKIIKLSDETKQNLKLIDQKLSALSKEFQLLNDSKQLILITVAQNSKLKGESWQLNSDYDLIEKEDLAQIKGK